MKKLTQKEGIAVGVALISVVAFVPGLFASNVQTNATDFSNDVSNVPSEHQAYFEEVESTISDFDAEDIVIGDGREAAFGDTVYVHYVGTLSNGDVFDTSTGSVQPYRVTLGQGEVITGWEIGLIGMREGGTRHLIIPPALAYGPNELADKDGNVIIPADTTLMFDIVLLQVDRGAE
ncbi:FKBP-type peptidyl-prolyl cis-trans isomerase [Candidatus Kaiserbacteria bacterium]|nr:MAG: FKBP-type peptidyl-prolyl cis-trans isomerase [Candidatus Kaiserbacteria bacterium]